MINRTLDENIDIDFIDTSIQRLQEETIEDNLIELYLHTLLMLRKEDGEENFKELQYRLKKEENNNIHIEELEPILTCLVNFCIKKINQGQDHYQNYLLEIYKEALKKGMYRDGKFINIRILKNIVSSGVRSKEFAWVRSIIEDNIKSIRKEQRKLVEAFCYGSVAFYQGNFKETIKYLVPNWKSMSNLDIFYYIDARFLLIRSYYELSDIKFEKTYITLKEYLIKPKHLPAFYKKLYKNALKILNLCYNRKQYNKGNLPKTIEKKLLNTKSIAYRGWLQEKIDELKL